MIVAWFSGGATSTIACKIALETLSDVELVYIETGSHHSDAMRYLEDCQRWLGQKIQIIRSERYENVFDVIKRRRFLNGPAGALCTSELKRMVREKFERENDVKGHVWGFDCEEREKNRAKRMLIKYPKFEHHFPLIEHNLTKQDCLRMITDAGIELPAMYRLGYSNANCVGCVKGGKSYWARIRQDFPEVFAEMARLERELGRSCLRSCFLDELPADTPLTKPIVQDCGSVGEGCEIELSHFFYNRE